jgi:hypothetical protein
MNRIKRDETASNATNGVVFRTLMERLKTYWVRQNNRSHQNKIACR